MCVNVYNEISMKQMQKWANVAFSGQVNSTPRVEIEHWSQGWGFPMNGKSITGGSMCIGNRVFSYGIGTHADSKIVLKLPSIGKRLCVFVGMDRNTDSLKHSSRKERLVFSVEALGKELFVSKPLGLDSPLYEINIDLNGAQEITLKVLEINGDIRYGHADWANIQIEIEDGTVIPVGLLVEKRRLGEIPPISFRMGGQSSVEVLTRSQFRAETLSSDKEGVSLKQAVWDDPVSGLAVTVEATEYSDFPAVEYVLRLKNNGLVDTPVLKEIMSADFSWLTRGALSTLYRSRGSTGTMEDFLYSKESIEPGASVCMTPLQGRSSNAWLPFFNVETGNQGFVMAIGWTGAWLAEFNYVDPDAIKIRAGLGRTRIALHPGEEIRLPRILLVFWEGESLTGHNLLRQFLVRHGTPRPGGQSPVVPVSFVSWGGGVPTSCHLDRISKLEAERVDCDCYWVEAGWYGPAGTKCSTEVSGEWSKLVGHWSPNPDTFPDSLRPISDAARKAGMKFILWFESERATAGTPWHKVHPEWFLGKPYENAKLLLNLGIPEARRFLTDYLSSLITREGVDIYRQDFNMDPLPLWRAADAPDRQGMTEIRHIEGLYEFWDELLRRHPHLLIDNTAAGGRRIDFETIRRSVPMWRSDYSGSRKGNSIGKQIQGMGLSYWMPYTATNTFALPNSTYDFRSGLAAGIALNPLIDKEAANMPEDYPWQWLRTMIAQLKKCRPAFSGDYYPLLPCTTDQETWAAYQMHRGDLEEGFLVAFRRDQSPFNSAQLVLKGLDRNKRYEIEDADTGEKLKIKGDTLLSEGFLIQISKPHEAKLFFLRARG